MNEKRKQFLMVQSSKKTTKNKIEAAFFLGNKVTVCSKTAESPWVAQIVMSIESLTQFGSDWKTTIELREPKGKETKHSSFTAVKINRLNIKLDNFETQIDQLRKDLAHIYYYYTHQK